MINRAAIEQVVVSAEQTRTIENRLFEAGMPVAALMEKVAGLIAARIVQLYPRSTVKRVGVLVGPGNNGGDALVVARELHLQGYQVSVCRPLAKLKELPASHADYAASLGIPTFEGLEALCSCELLIDGLFGFGLTRSLSGHLAETVNQLNSWSQPVVSIDLPSGLHTDTGEVLGTAVKATHTFCLGLWKRAFFQDQALDYIGRAELINFGIPPQDIWAILSHPPQVQRITAATVRPYLPLPRPLVTHKYKQGHLLLIGGSRRYAGGIILTGLGARASGVGMLSIAVPESLKPMLVNHLPEALIVGCPETASGAIAQLAPEAADWSQFDAIACGPGLTLDAQPILEHVLGAELPLVLDADGLNMLAQMETTPTLKARPAPTIVTPHPGEYKRLFPDAPSYQQDQITAVQTAAQQSGAIVLLKAARSAIAHPAGATWLLADSTPALARGGSGDVLTGLIGGVLAQQSSSSHPLDALVAAATWWHAQAGILAAQERTDLGVDAYTLTHYLMPALRGL